MKKLRSRKILKISSSYILNNDYEFNMSIEKARVTDCLVSIANNQVFSAIERITGNNNNYQLVDNCYLKINREKRKQKPNKQYISGVREQIDSLLFLPEIINVKVDNKQGYKYICKNGFICNGEKYVRLLCGAGMGRRSTVSFCQEKIYKKLDEILRNGLIVDEINIAKWNAYYGLYMSGCYNVTTPRFVVVPDCELSITGNEVDFIVDDKKTTPAGNVVDCRRIEKRDFVFEANVFDGAGLISPQMAYKWACDLEADYIPSNFIIRSAFIKGMVAVFDFHEFAKQNNKTTIIDCYGEEHNVNDIDVILTASQFKMWKKYISLDEYNNYSKMYGHVWGVSNFSKKEDKEYSLLNYQYIQTLNLNDEAINELTSYTEKWINKICSGDELYTKLFAYGLCEAKNLEGVLNNTDMGYLKALCLDFDLFRDDYIKHKIYQLAQKKIDEAKIGRLWVRGNYQTIIPDPYAMAQHIFGMEVTGLLEKDCHYSQFWIERGVDKINAMRSPMVDASEHKVSSIVNNEKMEYWYQYLYSGIVMNIWGLDTIIHSDSDADGDIIFTTNNKTMIDNIYPNRLPITYDKETAPAQKMNIGNVVKTDLNTFDCKIGQTTNYSTKFFSMLCNYNVDSREYKELTERIKLLRRYIGDSIDAGKGIKTKAFPAEWKSWKRVPEEWNDEQKREQWFLNNLVEKRKPYFFVYIYSNVMQEYKREKKRLNRECKSIFGVNFNELKNKAEKTQEEKNFIKKYYNELPVTKTPCIMNKIAWKIEGIECGFKYPKNTERENLELASKLMNGNYKLMKSKLEKICHIYNDWKASIVEEHRKPYFQMKNVLTDVFEYDWQMENLYNEEEVKTNHNLKELYKRELEAIIPNSQELADYLIHLAYREPKYAAMKSFCWLFGWEGIIQNLLEKKKIVNIPTRCTEGVEYLGNNYSLQGVTP